MTGGTGFLGSNLVKRLIRENFQLILLVRASSNTWRINEVIDDLALYKINEFSLDELFETKKIDIIIHCATNYGRREADPVILLEANLILPLKLLQLGCKFGVSSFINTDTVLDKRVNYYSLSKTQFKEWLEIYSNNMACINIALEHFYGPFDDKSKFVSFIVHNILNNAEKLNLTEGKQKRDFIYIDDVVDAFVKIIRHREETKSGYYHYEIGTNRTIEIREFVMLVKKLANNKCTCLNFGALPYREHEIMESHVDLSEVQKLNWIPKYSLEEGLQEIIRLEKEHNLK